MKIAKTCPHGTTRIHNVRFYNLEPRPISNIVCNRQHDKLALSRGDDSIEIWNIENSPYLMKIIPGVEKHSVEALAWCEERLFSAGLSGEITEWDLRNLEKGHTQLVTGNAIWCIDVNKSETCLAVGTEEGFLNVCEITETGLVYNKLFDKQEGRILCCKYDHSGDFIVTGSVDTIRIWCTKTGNALHRMTMGRSEAKTETIVWSLHVLKNFQIIAGDSRGHITFWDGKLGVHLQSYEVLKSHVLTVAVNEEENIFGCSGVDPIIHIYSLTTIKKENQVTERWIKCLQRSVHDHDVKSLVCVGSRFFSGGNDGYLGIASIERGEQPIQRYGPFLSLPCANVAKVGRLLMLRYWNYLEVWKLGNAEIKQDNEKKDDRDSKIYLSLAEFPEKLVQLVSRFREPIMCASLSLDGKYLIYSTVSAIRVFALTLQGSDGKSELCRIRDVPKELSPCLRVIFSSDSKKIIVAKSSRTIDFFDIVNEQEIIHSQTVDATRIMKDVIHLMEISNCGNYLVVAGTCRTIAVWTQTKKNQWKHYLNLPKYVALTSAIALRQNNPGLVATFTDGKIYEYDLDEMRFVYSANQKFVKNSYTHSINGILLDPRNDNVIILHNDAYMFTIDKSTEVDSTPTSTQKPKVEETEEDDEKKSKLMFLKSYEHFVHMSWLADDEIVTIGVNPVALIEQLPPALQQKKFGAA